jgi:acylaminoacyl-peptidase
MRILLLILLSASFSAQAQSQPFEPLDVFKLHWVSNPRVSADGDFVVYTHNFMDIMQDQRRSNLWRVDRDGSNARPVTSGARNDGGAEISPDGKRLAYVSADDKGAQIFLRWLESGETQQLTRLAHEPGSLSWSPDGQWLAFTAHVPKAPATIGEMPAAPEGAEWAKPPTVVERSIFRMDGAGSLPLGHSHVFVVSAAGGAPRQLTGGEFDHSGPIAWSADNMTLFFSGNRHEDAELNPGNSEIYRVSLEGGGVVAMTDRAGPDGGVAISPDGRKLAWRGYDDQLLSYHGSRLYVMDVDGGGRQEVETGLDRSIDGMGWGADSRSVYVMYDDVGLTKLARVSLRGGVTEVASDLSGLSLSRPYSGAAFAVGGNNTFAYTSGDALSPAELSIGHATGKAKQVTNLNANLLGHRDLAPVEERWVKSSFDGKDIQYWVAYPPGYDPEQKYPLILEIHGGPHTTYGPHFAAEIQLFAAAGYVVVYANPRGSTSYGEEFALEIHHNYPSQDYDDLMSVVDAVIGKDSIDSDRLYVTGGSGGGVLTAWIVGTSDRFRAAVVAKPVINWLSFTLSADLPPFFTKYWFPAMPWDDPMAYWNRSPLARAGNVTTPTMLLTGEEDWRTPMWESEQFYQALKLQGVDTALVRVPGASHSIARRPSQLIAKAAAILGWFDKYP